MSALSELELKYDGPIPKHELEAALKADRRWTLNDELAAMTPADLQAHHMAFARGEMILAWGRMRRLCKRRSVYDYGLIQAHREKTVYGCRTWLLKREELRFLLVTYHAAKERFELHSREYERATRSVAA